MRAAALFGEKLFGEKLFGEKLRGEKLVGVVRFERTTSCTQSRPSTKLRYTP